MLERILIGILIAILFPVTACSQVRPTAGLEETLSDFDFNGNPKSPRHGPYADPIVRSGERIK